jgi:hypothetical protein
MQLQLHPIPSVGRVVRIDLPIRAHDIEHSDTRHGASLRHAAATRGKLLGRLHAGDSVDIEVEFAGMHGGTLRGINASDFAIAMISVAHLPTLASGHADAATLRSKSYQRVYCNSSNGSSFIPVVARGLALAHCSGQCSLSSRIQQRWCAFGPCNAPQRTGMAQRPDRLPSS